LSGWSQPALAALAAELDAPFAVVDATDEDAVDAYLAEVVARAGGLDCVFDPIGPRADTHGYGQRATALELDDFIATLALIVGSQFLVARGAARHMLERGRGAIVTLSASLATHGVPFMAGVTAACGAVEAMTRSLAAEFGGRGVRVNCVRAAGMPETRTIQETTAAIVRTTGTIAESVGRPPSRRSLTPPETAALVAFLASDNASGISGQVVDAGWEVGG
jgi:NAD(P)-dependent dehydrogenase (short-subunit alcohol dehydrogenase family)